MRILITGGGGFLGASLARELLQLQNIHLEGKGSGPVTEVVLTDLVAPPADLQADARVRAMVGDLSHLLSTQALTLNGVDAIVHLAAAVSGECEANLDLGLQSNLQAVGERSMCSEGIPKGVLERILVNMHGISKR